jgi:diguanylate cyclase (GGDEF)-like protein
MRKRVQSSLAVLLMDLNRFKTINDTLGHHMATRSSRASLAGCRASRASRDTTARLGGDEFAVLLSNTTVDAGQGRGREDLPPPLEAPIVIGEHSLDVRARASAWPPARRTREDADMLMRHADAAMYAAKRSNADYAVYDSHSTRSGRTSFPCFPSCAGGGRG